jgi:arylsulfatase A-like enzyme
MPDTPAALFAPAGSEDPLARRREDVRGARLPAPGAAPDAIRPRPNVLLIMTDQHRGDALGCAGNPVLRTPALDRLAREGARCARAYVQNPICMPSRASLFTGRYVRSHRVWTNGVCLPPEEVTLAHVLGAAGYRTAAVGKLHFTPTGGPPGPGRYEAQAAWRDPAPAAALDDWSGPYYGFQTVQLALGHNAPGGHYGRWLRREHPEALPLFDRAAALRPPSGAPESWKSGLPVAQHSSTWVADTTIDFLRRQVGPDGPDAAGRPGAPFFAVCSFPDPHHPFAPPAPWADAYDPAAVPPPVRRAGELDRLPPHFREHFRGAWSRRGSTPPAHPDGLPEAQVREIIAHYYGMISLVDDNVGRVLGALDALGLAADTLVLFTSDHGELLGDHGLLLKGPFLYESLVRVPLLWRLPGRIAAGATLTHPVAHVDVVPTVLDLLGYEAPLGVQGQSLAPALRAGPAAPALRPWALTEYRTGFSPDLSLKQIQDGRYKLTWYGHGAFGELFDLVADPHELENRFHDPACAGVRRELQDLLLRALQETDDPLPPQIAFA